MMKQEPCSQIERLSDVYEFLREQPVNGTWDKPNTIEAIEKASVDNGVFYITNEQRKIIGVALLWYDKDIEALHCSICKTLTKNGLRVLAWMITMRFPETLVLTATRNGKLKRYRSCIARRIINYYK